MSLFAESRWEKWKLTLKDYVLGIFGAVMDRAQSPARIRPFEYVDPDTDETVYLYTDKRLSVLCVGSRRYYFDRVSGRFDGVSASVVDVTPRIELAD